MNPHITLPAAIRMMYRKKNPKIIEAAAAMRITDLEAYKSELTYCSSYTFMDFEIVCKYVSEYGRQILPP